MENLEIQNDIINLGKKIAEELGQDQYGDTLTTWVSHYISELIVKSEQDNDNADLYKQKCLDTILQVWAQRSCFPDGTRPFENFEPIFKFLRTIDPNTEDKFYYNDFAKDCTNKELKHLLLMAENIDYTARNWLYFVLKNAAQIANDSEVKSWLELSSNNLIRENAKDFEIVFEMVEEEKEEDQELMDLKEALASFTRYDRFNEKIKLFLKNEIEKREQTNKG